MAVRITCITKDNGNHENPYLSITSLGWITEGNKTVSMSSRLQIYEFLLANGQAYVLDTFGNKAYLITAISAKGNKYVKTIADETKTDNLLQLPEC